MWPQAQGAFSRSPSTFETGRQSVDSLDVSSKSSVADPTPTSFNQQEDRSFSFFNNSTLLIEPKLNGSAKEVNRK
jgi:hypothetical protein